MSIFVVRTGFEPVLAPESQYGTPQARSASYSKLPDYMDEV